MELAGPGLIGRLDTEWHSKLLFTPRLLLKRIEGEGEEESWFVDAAGASLALEREREREVGRQGLA